MCGSAPITIAMTPSIQASSIVATAAQETLAAVDHLFPDALGEDDDENADGDLASALGRQPWLAVRASKTGYVESLDADAVLDIARTLPTQGEAVRQAAQACALSLAAPVPMPMRKRQTT